MGLIKRLALGGGATAMVALLGITVAVRPAIAEGEIGPSVVLSNATDGNGEPVLSVGLENTAGGSPAAVQFDLTFDAASLQIADVVSGVSANNAGKPISFSEVSPGLLRFVVGGMSVDRMSDGGLVEVHFEPLDDSGGEFRSSVQDVVASDDAGGAIPTSVENRIEMPPEEPLGGTSKTVAGDGVEGSETSDADTRAGAVARSTRQGTDSHTDRGRFGAHRGNRGNSVETPDTGRRWAGSTTRSVKADRRSGSDRPLGKSYAEARRERHGSSQGQSHVIPRSSTDRPKRNRSMTRTGADARQEFERPHPYDYTRGPEVEPYSMHEAADGITTKRANRDTDHGPVYRFNAVILFGMFGAILLIRHLVLR